VPPQPVELAARGFPVALGARRVEKLEETRRQQIRADGGEAVALHLDVTDPNSVKAFVRQTDRRTLGDIEILVAGAGDTYFGKPRRRSAPSGLRTRSSRST
jgi:NADP-dependent 3-hydroxy acid dehydrogenase YdfG